jgi:ABC-2 type transport system ATP-binding protein
LGSRVEVDAAAAPAIVVRNLARAFGATKALVDVSFDVTAGSVCALLGRNGAGKTTTVRILTTLLRADSGVAQVAGFDVGRDPEQVRRHIGVTGQSATMDELLTGRENLETIGRFCHLGAAESRRRAEGLLSQFELTRASNQRVKPDAETSPPADPPTAAESLRAQARQRRAPERRRRGVAGPFPLAM